MAFSHPRLSFSLCRGNGWKNKLWKNKLEKWKNKLCCLFKRFVTLVHLITHNSACRKPITILLKIHLMRRESGAEFE